jgi:ElaB/YqjD/DUF883 family membrane-anchored ribosome-binding protein
VVESNNFSAVALKVLASAERARSAGVALPKETHMAEEQFEGLAREGLGRVEDGTGGLVGDAGLQAKGKLNEAAGAVQRALGDVQAGAERLVGDAQSLGQDACDEVDAFVRRSPWVSVAIAAGIGLLAGLAMKPSRRVYRIW